MKEWVDIIRALVRPTSTWFLLLLGGGIAAYVIVRGGPLEERAFSLVGDILLLVLGFYFGSRQKSQ